MHGSAQADKAQQFRQMHHQESLLVLPNIWDALGARLLVGLGYPAVATASAAVSFSHGYDDGEHIPFATLLQAVGQISRAVDVPISVDMERGYADTQEALADNVRALLDSGAVGINLEDSLAEGEVLRSEEEQCERIQTVRSTAERHGIPLFINARSDVFLGSIENTEEAISQAIERGKAYKDAGADGLYPIGLADLDALCRVQEETGLPVNVYASAAAPDAKNLQRAGIARMSAGPGLLRAAFTSMQTVAREFLDTGRSASIQDSVKSDEIRRYLESGK